MSATPAEQLSRPDRPGGWPLVAGLVVLGPWLSALTTTQLLAYRLGYAQALGEPWLVPAFHPAVYAVGTVTAVAVAGWLVGQGRARVLSLFALALAGVFGALVFGPLYPPLRGLGWLGPALTASATRPFALEAGAVGVATLVGFVALAALPLRWTGSGVAAIAHGSARLGGVADLEEAGLTSPTGVRLGVFQAGRHRVVLHDASEDHVLLVMPTGAGKTSGHIIPTLLSSPESAIVLDPKGELWQTTSGWRRGDGQRCLYFAPTSPDQQASAWNCLDEVRRGGELMLDLRVVAESFISTPAGEAQQSHWIASAQRLFQLLALHLIEAARQPEISPPHMTQVRALLNDPDRSLQAMLGDLVEYEHDPQLERGYRSPVTGKPTPTHPEVAMLARSFLSTPDRELGSIVSTLQRFLGLWADPLVAKNTSRSDFRLAELLSAEKPTTLYVVLPYGDLEPLGPLLRILLGLLIRRMTEAQADERAGPGGRPRTLFLLDEFAALGRLPILERMLGFFRGYGIRAVIVVQDLGQLVRSYSLQETISGNCQVHVAAATQSARTRAHLSALAGEATVRYRRRSRSGKRGALLSSRTTVAETETRRPLLTTGELGTLGKDRLLILKTGAPPVLAWKSPYFREPEMLRRAGYRPPSRAVAPESGRAEKLPAAPSPPAAEPEPEPLPGEGEPSPAEGPELEELAGPGEGL